MKKLNNQGFAVSGILYPILVLFLMLVIGLLDIMSSRKVIFDQTKNEILDELNDPNSLNEPVITVIGKDVTILNNKNVPGFNFDLKENVTAVTSEKTSFKKNQIMVSSEPAFNQGKAGVYKITYTVTDKYTKKASATRTVRVVDQQNDVNVWDYGDTTNFKGSYSTLVIPSTGLYQIQAWGASGYGDSYGGKGAYTRGEIELSANTVLYLFVGEKGARKTGVYNTTSTNFNGGGAFACGDVRYTGGGASDIRVVKPTTAADNWAEDVSLAGRIMVAAGGGAAGQTSRDNNPTVYGGSGGALSSKGGNGPSKGNPATQTSGAALGIGGSAGSATTTCSASNGSAGGGGYYGGYASTSPGSSGAGGSSYISGFDGCKTYASRIFKNAVMIPGDATMPNHAGTGTIKGNTGHGYIKILQLKVVNE